MHMHPEETEADYVIIHDHIDDDEGHAHPEIGVGAMEPLDE